MHPINLDERDVTDFLTDLAEVKHISASTQNQALSAILFLYRHILGRELKGIDAMRAKKPKRLPVVLSKQEVVYFVGVDFWRQARGKLRSFEKVTRTG